MTGHLIVTDEDATRMIKLRRPEKKNAITQDMYRGMSDAIDTAQNNPDIRCLIITGGSGVLRALCTRRGKGGRGGVDAACTWPGEPRRRARGNHLAAPPAATMESRTRK